MEFEPDQQPDPVLVGKAIHDMVAVLPCALEQITGDTGIQRSVTVTCKQVDSRLFFHAHSLRSVDWIPACAGMTVPGVGRARLIPPATPPPPSRTSTHPQARQSVGWGQGVAVRVGLGGARIIHKTQTPLNKHTTTP